MGAEGMGDHCVELLERLDSARGGRVEIVAILWTWLERHPLDLGSLTTSADAIRTQEAPPGRPTGIDDEMLAWIREAPMLGAARLLARIAAELDRDAGSTFIEATHDIGGGKVLVALREPPLVAAGENGLPPRAAEQPSLAALAPRLVVCPVSHESQVELAVVALTGPEWQYADWLLARSRGRRALHVHLDTLGEHGLSGLEPDPGRGTARYTDCAIDADDHRAVKAAARTAVEHAATATARAHEDGRGDVAAILVMPELVATEEVQATVAAAIAAEIDHPPALTVIGLRHRPTEDPSEVPGDLADPDAVSEWVNEAVVLGPTGQELWRQRKASSAGGKLPRGGPRVTEGIRLGRTLAVAQTPVGMISLLICLDSFTEQMSRRMAASPADFVLVPSLSPHVHRHRETLQVLVQRLWGIACVCNRAPFAKNGETVWNEPRHRSFWAVARRPITIPAARPDGEHPSFVFDLGAHTADGASDAA